MRRILTFFAVLVTMVSVAAGPQFIKKANVRKIAPVYGCHITPRVGQKADKLAIAKSRQHGQKMVPGKTSLIRRAQATYEYTYSVCSYEGYDTDTWFSITTNDNAYKFYFDILLPESALEEGKTYTMADCDKSFTYLSDNTTYAMIQFTDLALTLNKDADGKFVVDAMCTTENDEVFHLKHSPQDIPETFTEVEVGDIDIRLHDFASSQGVFQFTGKNDVYDIGIGVKTNGQVEGTWTTADLMEGDYTYINKDKKNVRLCDVSLEVTSLGGHNYRVDGKMYAYDGNVYIVKGNYVEPTLKNTANITASNLNLDDEMFEVYKNFYGYGHAGITASNDEYSITGSIISYTDIAGHYDDYNHMINELYITDANGKKTDFFSGDLDIQKVDDSWTIKGNVLCWDNTQYSLDLYFVVPDIKGEASFASVNGELNDQTSDFGGFQIYALDEKSDEEMTEFSVVLPAIAVTSGHYGSLSEADKNYCYIYSDGKVYQMYSVDFDLDTDGETFTLTGTCQAGDLLWDVNVSGAFLSNDDPCDATPDDGEIDVAFSLDEISAFEVSATEGYAYLEVKNSVRNDVWACMFYISGDKLSAGDYPIEATYAAGTVQPGLVDDGYNLYPTTYFRLDEEGYASLPVWYCSYGTVTVDYDAGGNIVVDCEAQNSHNVRVHVTVNAQGADGIQQVANGNEQKDGKYVEDKCIVIRSRGEKYNTLGQKME